MTAAQQVAARRKAHPAEAWFPCPVCGQRATLVVVCTVAHDGELQEPGPFVAACECGHREHMAPSLVQHRLAVQAAER